MSRNILKRWIAVCLILCAALTFAACDSFGVPEQTETTEKPASVDETEDEKNTDDPGAQSLSLEEKLMSSSWEETYGTGSLVLRFLGGGKMNGEASGRFESGYSDTDFSSWMYAVNSDSSLQIYDEAGDVCGIVYDMQSENLVRFTRIIFGNTAVSAVLYKSSIKPYDTYEVQDVFLGLLNKSAYSFALQGEMIEKEVNDHGKWEDEYGVDIVVSGENYQGTPISNTIMFFCGEGNKDFWMEHLENDTFALHFLTYETDENGQRDEFNVEYSFEEVTFK